MPDRWNQYIDRWKKKITNEKKQKYKQNIWEIMGWIRITGYERMRQKKNDTQLSQRGIIVQKGERGKKELLIRTTEEDMKEEELWTWTNIF